MNIKRISLYAVCLPFQGEFSHAQKKGKSANNMVVEIETEQFKGYGEGAPRPYVTGETQESVMNNLRRFIQSHDFPWDLDSVTQIWNFIDTLSKAKEYNAAVCALEMALLDALGMSEGRPIAEYFPRKYATDTVYYGGTIPLGDAKRKEQIIRILERFKLGKIRIKMGIDYRENKESLHTIKTLFPDADIRVDVNSAWNRELALQHLDLLHQYSADVIEDPLPLYDNSIGEFSKRARENNTTLMADEPACSFQQVHRIIQDGYYDIINIKLSKCGGFQRSLQLIDLLRKHERSFQIGCQMGESGILSAAGRTLSLLCGDARYHDGSYDALLLQENITCEQVGFGKGGKAGPLSGNGIGVTVNEEKLRHLSSDSLSIHRPS